ncbi:MAG: hypothetical protein ACKESB_02530 [Candidatus Hodgkinia cicadicola]
MGMVLNSVARCGKLRLRIEVSKPGLLASVLGRLFSTLFETVVAVFSRCVVFSLEDQHLKRQSVVDRRAALRAAFYSLE